MFLYMQTDMHFNSSWVYTLQPQLGKGNPHRFAGTCPYVIGLEGKLSLSGKYHTCLMAACSPERQMMMMQCLQSNIPVAIYLNPDRQSGAVMAMVAWSGRMSQEMGLPLTKWQFSTHCHCLSLGKRMFCIYCQLVLNKPGWCFIIRLKLATW